MVDDDDTVRRDATLRGHVQPQDPGTAVTVASSASSPFVPKTRASDPIVEGSRYTIGHVIGEGGMGEVLLAVDEQIGRQVAVKRTRTAHPRGEELARFLREARVQGRLEHPAVVPVHDLSIDATGRPFFVMKRLTGEAMSDVLKRLRSGEDRDPAATRRRLLRAFAEVCLAVEFAHKDGIIHRDLKPANIMLGEYGEVYVIDWGIARAVTEPDDTGTPPSGQHDLKLDTGDTRQGTVLGTPAYMSPEQLAGDRAGPAADIYALGCILYEIAAGTPLHAKVRTIGQALQVVDGKPSSRRPESPPELDAICERALAIEAAARFPSARALGDAVQAFLDGDRDLVVRRELAQRHVADARGELAKGDAADRRAAMQAAGRALALDPTASDAGDIITRLMLEPPKQMPAEVDAALEAQDTESARTQGRLAAIAMLGYLAFIPILFWTGVRDATWVAIFGAVAVACGLQVWSLTRFSQRIPPIGIYLNACMMAVLIGVVCRLVGPLIIAPTLVATTMVAYAAHPKLGRTEIVAVILISAVAIPWALEIAGVIEPTYRFAGGAIVLSSPIVEFSPVPVQVAFGLLLVTLVTVVAVLSRNLARNQRDATRKLELQAWHLRQILPSR